MPLSTETHGFIIDPLFSFMDDKGKTIKNGFVRVFLAGSSTPAVTYLNWNGSMNQETIQLDNSGRCAMQVIGQKDRLYKVCVYDSHHSQETPILTIDNVQVLGTVMAILDNSVTTEKLVNESVTTQKINNGAVTTAKLAAESVTAEKIAANAVTTNKIIDGAITEEKLADDLKILTVKDYLTPQMFGAKGDGVTDDTAAIQNAVNQAFTSKTGVVFFPSGKYRITSPIICWARKSDLLNEPTNPTVSVNLIGESETSTFILKDGTTKSSLNDHKVDAFIIIASENYRDPSYTSPNIETGSGTACFYPIIANFTLKSFNASTYSAQMNAYGIYSQGWFFGKFCNITIGNAATGLYTQTWNCYSGYVYLDLQYPTVGFDFDNTHIGGQTTMTFVRCHINAPSQYGWSLIGNGTLYGCVVDGGTAEMFNFTRFTRSGLPPSLAVYYMIDCYHEGVMAKSIISAYTSTVNCSNCHFETRSNASGSAELGAVIIARNSSYLYIEKTSFWNRSGTTPIQPLYEKTNSVIKFIDCPSLNPYTYASVQNTFDFSLFSKFNPNYNVYGNDGSTTVALDADGFLTVSRDSETANDIYLILGEYDMTEVQQLKVFADFTTTGTPASYIRLAIGGSITGTTYSGSTAVNIRVSVYGEPALMNVSTTVSEDKHGDVSSFTGKKIVAINIYGKHFSAKIYGVTPDVSYKLTDTFVVPEVPAEP